MASVRLHIAYDGVPFHGWQFQPHAVTVEGALLDALAQLLDRPVDGIEFQGASRTDAGVHAIGQVASLRYDADRSPWDIIRGLNGLTPETICVNHVEPVDEGFNARHDSGGKRYRYTIWNNRWPHPLRSNRSWTVAGRLDLAKMRRAAGHLVGTHDFSGFRAADCGSMTTVRQITRVELLEGPAPELELVVEGTAFLKYMVRILAGTLVDIGLGRLKPDAVLEALATGDRGKAGRTAPPQGLCLEEVFYPDHPWLVPPRLGLRERY